MAVDALLVTVVTLLVVTRVTVGVVRALVLSEDSAEASDEEKTGELNET